jgi:hypothetical protein
MGRSPATRARSAQEVLSSLDEHTPGLSERVRARIPAESLAVIDRTAATGWIPVEHDRWIPQATIEELGEVDAVAYLRSFLGGHMRTPLLRAILDGAIRMFGMSPGSIVRMLPRAWSLIFRDQCRVEIEARDAHSARVVLHDVAPEVIEWSAYPISFRAFMLGIIDLVDAEGEVTMEIDVARRRLVYSMRWH